MIAPYLLAVVVAPIAWQFGRWSERDARVERLPIEQSLQSVLLRKGRR